MKYAEFERVMSPARMTRYLAASTTGSKGAMTLYRRNLELSQELFTVISCFEISLRNRIDQHYMAIHGHHWLRDATAGMFSGHSCRVTRQVISDAVAKLGTFYTHDKLVAAMDFGLWRFLFASPQFTAGGQTLLRIFPGRPTSTPAIHYNHTFVFNQLQLINELRNRIAHHEPICFQPGRSIKDTTYARQRYSLIKQLFQWMGIDESALLYGMDHVLTICDAIDRM